MLPFASRLFSYMKSEQYCVVRYWLKNRLAAGRSKVKK
ncbi:hypothetical protein EPIR_0579 [Erwinia piriflorinigrans CFBP 5888]|uniref:Uncharacterized protein n=1 Tax=Erwinia piriflorinigrans CFBP 5888 TaxID=1161919 RepID=V5Z4L7_9GAMM|nr:hypothetical protein EPIR_0579 [Erwinia piriflorinigrans CFBP 5888]